MSAPNYANKGDLIRIDLLQSFAVFYGYQAVAGTVNNVGVAVYMANPFIGTQMVT